MKWIKTTDRLPTEEDGKGSRGYIQVLARNGGYPTHALMADVEVKHHTHWRRVDMPEIPIQIFVAGEGDLNVEILSASQIKAGCKVVTVTPDTLRKIAHKITFPVTGAKWRKLQ